MVRRPCLQCGVPTTATRCPTCQRQQDRARNARRTWYHHGWEKRSRRARTAWIAEHGMTCPGHNRPPHPADQLTLDHTTGKVLCLTCNINAGPARH